MNLDKIKKEIKEQIVESGFPLEIFCRDKICRRGWGLNLAQYYPDPERNLIEIDIEFNLQTHWKKTNKRIILDSNFLVECKKSAKNPWVFFKEDGIAMLNTYSDVDNINSLRHLDIKFIKEAKGHHFNTSKNIARNYFVGSKERNEKRRRQIYESISNLINIFRYEEEFFFKVRNNKDRIKSKHYFIVVHYLVIVLDGLMFMADLTKKDIKLKKINHAIISVSKRDPDGRLNQYSIDVVSKSYFDAYLDIIKKDHAILEEFFKKP